MMTNLFSTFDRSLSIMSISLNWMSTVVGLLITPSIFWLFRNRMNII